MSEEGSPNTSKSSLALLSLGCAVFAFLGLLISGDLSGERNFSLEPSINTFVAVGIVAIPLLIWHLCDLIDSSHNSSNAVRALASYPVMVVLNLGALALYVALMLGVGVYETCRSSAQLFGPPCSIKTSLWILLPLAAIICVAWLLAAVKAILSIWSSFQLPK
ncbi:MAG: hypothetical protein AAFR64_06720 [Pseudomonadota bacterium]